MDTLLFTLALLAQTADAALTCRTLAEGGREVNPALVRVGATSCAPIVAVKVGAVAAIPLFPKGPWRRVYMGTLVASGAVGVTFTLRSQ